MVQVWISCQSNCENGDVHLETRGYTTVTEVIHFQAQTDQMQDVALQFRSFLVVFVTVSVTENDDEVASF